MDTNGNDVSATQLCTVRYGLRSRFSSGNDTSIPAPSHSKLAMRYASLSHGRFSVLKALQLKDKNWRAVMKPE